MRQNALSMRRFHRRGFTLLELLLAMALFIVLLGILWNIISMFQRTQTRGTRLAERSQLVRSLAQLLEDDLRAAIQDPIHSFEDGDFQGGDDDVRRFGLSGSAQTLRIDVIEFNPFVATETAITRPPRPAAFGEIRDGEPRAAELKTVFYDFRNNEGLSRREIDFETPNINAPGPEGSAMLAPEAVRCRFRYFNGSDWSDSWDSLQRDGLPVAIEATLQLLPLAEARRVRDRQERGETLEQAVAAEGFAMPLTSRIVAHLSTSPIQKHEPYQRKAPPKKDVPFPAPPPPPPTSPTPAPPPAMDLPSSGTPPTGPQQSWIRGG